MNRTKVVVGCSLVVLAAAAIGQLMLDVPQASAPKEPNQDPQAQQAAVPAETKAVTADEVVGTFLPSLKDGEEAARLVALGGFVDVMEGSEYGKSSISLENGEELSQAIAPLVHETTGEAKESWEVKIRAAKLIVGRTQSETAREFALKTLEIGPADLREAVAQELGRPEGIGGRKIFAKLQETGALITPATYAAALRRVGGKKAVEPITALMKSSSDASVVTACVIALQDYQDPALMGAALERLEQTGLIDDGVKMPWISSKLLSQHLETAEGSALARGVKVLRARPTLARRGAAIFERAFEKGDEETKRIAAEAVKKAVMARTIDEDAAGKMLAAHPIAEAQPVLKAALPAPADQPKQQ
jgi:hypothetical protein